MCQKKTTRHSQKMFTTLEKMAKKFAAARSYKVRTQLFSCLFELFCVNISTTPCGLFLPFPFADALVAFLWFYGPRVHLAGSSEACIYGRVALI